MCVILEASVLYMKLEDGCVVFPTAFADAAVAPIDFPIAPAYAVPKVSLRLTVLKVQVTNACV